MFKLKWLLIGITLFYLSCDTGKKEVSSPPGTPNDENLMTTPVKDIHSYARPEQAIIQHLVWDAKVDFDSNRIQAKASIKILRDPTAEAIVLDTKNLHIERVTLGETSESETSFQLGRTDAILGSPLTISLQKDSEWVNIYYYTDSLAEALQWLEPQQTDSKTAPFLFTQSQAILARSWIPIQDSPGIRFTYEARVEVPPGLMALMSAENPQKMDPQGIYSFKMEQPIPAYLMALAVGELQFQQLGGRSGVYAEPGLLPAVAYEFAELESMITAAEELYGSYGWGRYDILVLPASFPFGGMENPRLTFATPTILAGDRSLTSLVAHELAHSWSGNLVTNATWEDFWLNEGFTVYFEYRIMEALYGRDYSEMLALLSLQDLKQEVEEMIQKDQAQDTHLKLDLKGRNPDDGVTAIAYDKGYYFLRWLEERVGRDIWDSFIKEYFEKHAFRSMTTEQFLDYLLRNLIERNHINIYPEDIHRWVYSEGLPESLVAPQSARFSEVDQSLNNWLTEGRLSNTDNWSTHEWLHFLKNLPADIDTVSLSQLDQKFNFTSSRNAELQSAWYLQAIKSQYQPAYASLEEFLIRVGRRKFLVPLYRALVASTDGKKMAMEIYEQARPNYHYVAVRSVDEIVEWTEEDRTR